MSVTDETNRTNLKGVSIMKQNASAIKNYLDSIAKYNKELESNPMAKAILSAANAKDFATAEDVQKFADMAMDAADVFARMAYLALDIRDAYSAE